MSFEQRYKNKIPWVQFANTTGQTIPPYSVIQATQWHTPDPTVALGTNFLSPYFDATMPGGNNIYLGNATPPVNPYTLYITGDLATPPTTAGRGPNGQAARPDTYPQLATFFGQGDGISPLCGPSAGSFSLTPGSAGFITVGSALGSLCPVTTFRGPYIGKANQNIGSGASGPVDMWIGTQGAETDGGTAFTVYNRFGLLAKGAWCLFDWVADGWEVIELTSATIVKGQLAYPLFAGGNTTMNLLDRYGNIQSTITVYEVLGINGYSFPTGTFLDALWNVTTQQWEVLQPLPQVMRASLTAALASGGSATALATNNKTYTVYEVLGLNGGSIASGTNITAFYNNDTGHFEVNAAGCTGSGTSGSNPQPGR